MEVARAMLLLLLLMLTLLLMLLLMGLDLCRRTNYTPATERLPARARVRARALEQRPTLPCTTPHRDMCVT